VVNQANALCGDHDVEIASVFRHRDTPGFTIDPRVRLVPLTELRTDGSFRTSTAGGPKRFLNKTRRFRSWMPYRHDRRFRRWDPVVDLKLLRYLWAAEDGILVTTRPGLNLLSARAAPRRLIRVAQDHMNLGTYKPALRDAIIRAYPRLDAVTVLTEQDRRAYEQVLGGTAVRLEQIPNGVPRPALPPSPLTAKVVIAAGRLLSQKGFDLLLDAFSLVSAKHPDWQLRIFGSGPWREQLTAQIERLGLTGRARLPGATDSLDAQFRASSIFVLSSRFEGLPMVLLEAMTAGLPSVAFDCPTGPAEIIEHGTSGILAPPQDVAALAAGICELIESPARRRAMGAAASARSQDYSIDTVRRKWDRLFGELAASRTPARDTAVFPRYAADTPQPVTPPLVKSDGATGP
jgi:glycosyltransferase involved in cell wall biosynthesis